MQCLRAISSVNVRDRVRNEAMRTALHMSTTISDIIEIKGLKWFRHVAQRPIDGYNARVYRFDFSKPGFTGGENSRRERGSREDYALR